MREMFRYFLVGPCLGGSVGLAQTGVAAATWVRHGQPDFYFRGWGAVEWGLVLWAVGGAILGVPFAAVVSTGEWLSGRRVRAVPALFVTVAAVEVATWVIVEGEFARRELHPAFTHEGVVASIAGIVLAAWSRSQTPNQVTRCPPAEPAAAPPPAVE
jgi:hypothetical protein